nr:unnamed protein product [Callosobruchus chinensis]
MLRQDILTNLNSIFKLNSTFGYGRVVCINFVVVLICIMFACFLPRIGTLIRYTGALSGLVYIFLLPSLLQMASLKKEDRLTMPKVVLYSVIIVIGGLNLFSQFFISDAN